MEYYIYAHKRIDNGEIFYIGKGSGKRAYIKSNRNEYWKRIANKYGYEILFLKRGLSEEDSYKYEIDLIAKYKKIGQCYANFTNGGDGVNVSVRWWNDKISKSLLGIKRYSGVDNPSYKDVISKEELLKLYVEDGLNITQISNMYNISTTTIASRLKENGIQSREKGRKKIKIICIEDGIEFNSISDAAKYYNLYRENIKKVIEGKYKTTGNKHFKKI